MPPASPLADPVMVSCPPATEIASGVRRPFPPWPGPSYMFQSPETELPSNSSATVGLPQPSVPAAVVLHWPPAPPEPEPPPDPEPLPEPEPFPDPEPDPPEFPTPGS